jgi:Protein of unknown function (DUF2778)
MRDPLSKAEHYRKLVVKYRELAKFAQPTYLGDFYRGIAVRYAFMAQEASERANKDGFNPERRVRPEPFSPQGQVEEVAIDVRKRREEVGGGTACTREPRKARDRGVPVRIGLRSTSAVVGALAFGFTLGLVVKYGLADAGPRRVPARLSDLETATSFDLLRPDGSQVPSTSGMRLASLEMSVSDFPAEDIDPSALARPPVFFGDRLLLDGRLDSFDERFGGAVVSSYTAPATTSESESADTAGQPSLDLREKATGQSAIGRSAPKPAAASALASAAKNQVRTADLSHDLSSLPPADSHTAVYDIAARTVYMPNGSRLEAHSGLGNLMDDPSYIRAKGRGPTPPNVYDLTLREELFHGVRAIRLNPVDESKMFGRDGILAHTYMLGPNGQSNGCVSFSNYNAFLTAYLSGEVTRLVVVDHLADPPGPQPAAQWFADTIKDLLRRT